MTQLGSSVPIPEVSVAASHGEPWSTSRRSFIQALSALFVAPNQILNLQIHESLPKKLIKDLTVKEKGWCTELLLEGINRFCKATENLQESFSCNFATLPFQGLIFRAALEEGEQSLSQGSSSVSISEIKLLADDYGELTKASGFLRSLPIWEELQSLLITSNRELVRAAKQQYLNRLNFQFSQQDRSSAKGVSSEISENETLLKRFIAKIEAATSEDYFFDDLEDYFENIGEDCERGKESDFLDELIEKSGDITDRLLDQVSRKQAVNENKILKELGLTPTAIERFQEMLDYNFGKSLSSLICSRPKRLLPDLCQGDATLERALIKIMGENSNIFDQNALAAYQEQLVQHVGNSISEYNGLFGQLQNLKTSQFERGEAPNLDLNQSLSDANNYTKGPSENPDLSNPEQNERAQEKESQTLKDLLSEELTETGSEILSLPEQVQLFHISISGLKSLADKLKFKALDLEIKEIQTTNLSWDEIDLPRELSDKFVLLISDVPAEFRLSEITADKLNREVITGALLKGDLLVFDPSIFTCKIKPGSLASGELGILYVEL